MPAIEKTIVTVTVLHPAGEGPAEDCTLEDIERALDDDWIGTVEFGEPVPVPPQAVEKELRAVGNDGGFFQDDDEE